MRFVPFNIEHTYFEIFILMNGVDSISTLITDMSELLLSWLLLNFIFFFWGFSASFSWLSSISDMRQVKETLQKNNKKLHNNI